VVSVLDSWLEDCGVFKFHPMLDGNGFKAMPGLITAPNPGSLIIEKKKNKGIQMGHTNKYQKINKNNHYSIFRTFKKQNNPVLVCCHMPFSQSIFYIDHFAYNSDRHLRYINIASCLM